MKQHLNASNALPSLVPLLLLHIILIFQTLATTTRAQGTFFFDNRVPGSWETNFIGLHDCSNNSSNYTSGSQFESNLLNDVLPTLIANGSRDNFVMATFGEVPDKVYGLVHCRGDISEEDCGSCLKLASANITQSCPNKKSAGLRLANCLIRYSDISFFNKSSMNLYKGWNWANDKPITNMSGFYQKLDGLFTNLNSDASKIPSRFKSGWTMLSDLSTIYGLVQCTQDLSTTDCLTCLQKMMGEIPRCCSGIKGVWITSLSCQIMYGRNLFFRLPSPPPPPPPPPPPHLLPPLPQQTTGKSPNVAVIVAPIMIGSVLLSSVALCVYLAKRKTRRKRKRETTETGSITGGIHRDDIGTADSLQFDLHTIKIATNNFSDANKLGQGGFGAVYKGKLLDKQEVAVKRLSSNSGQGSQEFKNEVVLLHGLQHRNLVRLLGFCLEREEKILIYEYVPNTSLDKYLFDPKKRSYLDWETRYRIIGGIARGLLYLHEDSRLRIIHRDLKAGNILLDREMNAKIADFGMAKLFGVDQTQGNTNRIAGTFGYMAPEYIMQGLFSVKSDVYSFGVLLLEIISGQKISSFDESGQSLDYLLSCAWRQWREGTALELMDPALKDSFKRDQAMRCIHIGLLCVQDKIDLRPIMSEVVLMLSSYSMTLSVPTQPAFCAHSEIGSESITSSITYSAIGR